MNLYKELSKWVHFFFEPEKPYQINLIRAASQNFLLWLVLPMQSIYLRSLGASGSQVGWITGLGGLIGGILCFFLGTLVHKLGVKKIFMWGSLGIAVGGLLLAIAHSLLVAISGIVIFLSFRYGSAGLCRTICGTCLEDDIRARGMQLCDTLSAVPRLVAPSVSGVIVFLFGGLVASGIRPLYYIEFAGFCLIAFLVWRLFIEPRKIKEEIKKDGAGFRERFHQLFKQGNRLKSWILFRSLAYMPWYAALVYVPLFAKEVKHAGSFTVGGIQTAMWVGTLLFALPMGSLADRHGRKRVTFVMILIYILSILLFIFSPNRLVLVISGFFQGSVMLSMVTQSAMGIELIPIPFIGEWLGTMGLVKGVLALLSPAIAGLLWGTFGPFYTFYFVIASSIIALPFLAIMPETLVKAEE